MSQILFTPPWVFSVSIELSSANVKLLDSSVGRQHVLYRTSFIPLKYPGRLLASPINPRSNEIVTTASALKVYATTVYVSMVPEGGELAMTDVCVDGGASNMHHAASNKASRASQIILWLIP